MKSFTKYAILFVLVIFLSTCKKYPENRFFGKPWNYYPVAGYITEFKINGVDSMEALNHHYKKDYYSKVPGAPDDVRKLQFTGRRTSKLDGEIDIGVDPTLERGTYDWLNEHKQIYFEVPYSGTNFRKLLFPPGATWDVMRFDKNGVRKYKTIYNGNTYEVTYNPN